MCGINGFYSKTRILKADKRISKMNLAINHRGPDAQCFSEYEKNIMLGHVRLSIIDVRSLANQPMFTNSKKWGIVFNGEIYNFKEIKKELKYSFKTNSDTEVIIAAVEEYGVDWFISKANGMFAIALFNYDEEKLFLIRDRMGIKPLYYFNDDEKIIFSSEIKGVLSSGLLNPVFNEAAIDEYLGNRYIRAPYTFFKNIYQVKPGFYLEIGKDLSIKENKYWDLPEAFNTSNSYKEDKIIADFDQELNKAVNYRLISDVPLGTYLSGGVDSSIITAITVINSEKKINTYTIGFKELNEFKYSKIIANKYNTNHHEILMDKDEYIDKWKELIRYKDAPLGVPNEIPLALMSTKLKEKITVVLSGEGADELLGGYGRIFRLPFDYENHKKEKSFYDTFINAYEYVPRAIRDKVLNSSTEYRKVFDEVNTKAFSNHSNEENVFRFFHKYHVKGLLQRVDMTTMQTSVEARVPFLDHNLIEFSYKNIPYDLKLKWLNNTGKEEAKFKLAKDYSEVLDIPKYILRKISYKYLPKEIIERKKVGFPVPLNNWFTNLENLAKENLSNSKWLKKEALEELILKIKDEERAGQILWMFLNIEFFKNNYFEKTWKWD
ncbi:asparagine synthase (glutamine-hydrolyzing) [Polaribacter sp. P097]|uniref:asparagine synthase (glutamine-hydrolyzing) n=1 Tax=Polaribacter sp. P097 TaxID=3117398 RepID=UPI002FDF16C8